MAGKEEHGDAFKRMDMEIRGHMGGRCRARSIAFSRFSFLLTLALALTIWWLIFQVVLAHVDTIRGIAQFCFTASGQ